MHRSGKKLNWKRKIKEERERESESRTFEDSKPSHSGSIYLQFVKVRALYQSPTLFCVLPSLAFRSSLCFILLQFVFLLSPAMFPALNSFNSLISFIQLRIWDFEVWNILNLAKRMRGFHWCSGPICGSCSAWEGTVLWAQVWLFKLRVLDVHGFQKTSAWFGGI